MEMKPVLSPEGVDYLLALATGETLGFRFREIRRERTGVHALLAIILDSTILGYDTFNIGRREERQRLGNAAYKMIHGDLTKGAITNNELLHQLDIAALQAPQMWEEERISIESYDDNTPDPGPVLFVLKPYIIRGGGTIFYAPPKSGKSYLLQAMGIHIGTKQGNLWRVTEARPVLYINLERDRQGFIRREIAIKKALGVTGSTNVHYLHARGMALNALRQKVRRWLQEHPGSGVILDSISRAQTGKSLTDDDTGNHFIDMMHGLEPPWWAAAGHTPRANDNHIFGTVMFDAGMDIGVQISKENKDNRLGIRLEIADANDIGKFTPENLALEFDGPEGALINIRGAMDFEFSELMAKEKISQSERLKLAIENSELGNLTAMEASRVTSMDNSQVSKLLKGPDFEALPRVGTRGIPYQLRHQYRS